VPPPTVLLVPLLFTFVAVDVGVALYIGELRSRLQKDRRIESLKVLPVMVPASRL